jgi:gas vesicle protein
MANTGTKVMLACLAGLAAGIGIGLLFAPVKGSKTRKRLKKKVMNMADILQDDLSDKLHAIKSAMQEDEKKSDDED